ncbi:hypothetical protein OG520_25285 [Streptomyces sp. NBC_00984]|uniref:hypothetical protein n=1 Tax=Streptomyces sp. NBC_00984 TaxID=2903700 RepID=UPI00386CC106|nr:hypothetical protein OG520_25285 [Streptomyces sp. NBC_00984]
MADRTDHVIDSQPHPDLLAWLAERPVHGLFAAEDELGNPIAQHLSDVLGKTDEDDEDDEE